MQRHRRSRHIWNHLLPSLLLLTSIALDVGVSAQCFGGVETYEKTAGTTVLCSAADGCNSRGLLTQPDTSVTRDCIAICKQSSACNIFTVGKRHFINDVTQNWLAKMAFLALFNYTLNRSSQKWAPSPPSCMTPFLNIP